MREINKPPSSPNEDHEDVAVQNGVAFFTNRWQYTPQLSKLIGSYRLIPTPIL